MSIAFIALALLEVVLRLSLTQGYYLALHSQSSELQIVVLPLRRLKDE